MSRVCQSRISNRLLRLLLPDDFALLQPYLQLTHHRSGDSLACKGEPIQQVCFPEGGVVAFLDQVSAGERIAAGLVGLEGMVGADVLLGQERWGHSVLLRGADAALLSIDVDRLRHACRLSGRIEALLLRFAGNLMRQFARNAALNLTAPLEVRLARWILLYHDRLEGDEFPMTHEEISIMLGVRRASATDILHVLEGHGAIRNQRCRLLIRDRARLEQLAGSAYGDVEANYRTLIGPFGKGATAARPAFFPAR
jgi:CRP-like cAMP-binding protein